jgi:hypothetical protein
MAGKDDVGRSGDKRGRRRGARVGSWKGLKMEHVSRSLGNVYIKISLNETALLYFTT